ncbi:hypothetical protein K523DRAFT_373994 [Schizophyllum commune Tattone D]|nr:hypothetical protein K523DRAFT_373994 [Schizophyllum commune Tattone D]
MAPVPIPAASVCFRCQNPGSSPERFMLQCCECKRTWHHTCHAPPVPEKDLIEGIRAFNDNHVENIFTMWTCKRCGKKPKASRATSSLVDERRATANAPARLPTGAPIIASKKHASVVPPGQPVVPLPKLPEPPAPPPLKRDAPLKPSATASQARPAAAALAPMDVDDDKTSSQSHKDTQAVPQRVAEEEAQRAPSAHRQPDYSALSVQITTPQPSSRGTSQANPYAGRLAGPSKVTTSKKSTPSKRTAKAPVPATASTLAPTTNFTPSTTSWRPNAPLLQSTASFASSASLASATSSRATSLSSFAINRPHSADGTVIDLGDRLEEMNVDTPDAGSTPYAASPVPCAARTGVGLDEITALLRARPVLPAQVRTLAGPKAPVPGVSLPYEWLSQKKLGAEATHPSSRHAPPQRRSRKMVATKGRMLEPEMLMVGGMVASV